jgi:hypothetical protein
MNGLAGMITGSGQVWVLSGLWVSRLMAALALRAMHMGGEDGSGQAVWGGGGEGRPAGPPAGFVPLG